MREVCRMLHIKQAMSNAYHFQTGGQTECANKVEEEIHKHYVSPPHDDWDEHLDMAEFAINDALAVVCARDSFHVELWAASIEFLELADSVSCACYS